MIYFLQLLPNVLLFNTGSSEQSCSKTHQVLIKLKDANNEITGLLTFTEVLRHALLQRKVCKLHVFLKAFVSLSPLRHTIFLLSP